MSADPGTSDTRSAEASRPSSLVVRQASGAVLQQANSSNGQYYILVVRVAVQKPVYGLTHRWGVLGRIRPEGPG